MSTDARATHPSAIILAAGKGTRMKSDLPKVAFPVGGRPMVCAVVDACLDAGCERIVVVVGHRQEVVRDALAGYGTRAGARIEFAVQAEQLGTGHAVMSASALMGGEQGEGDTYVLAGDGPLIRPVVLHAMLDAHRRADAAATLATSVIPDPTGYGRIVRDAAGRFREIVEHKNCTPEQRAIREVNPSYYLFGVAALFGALRHVTRNPVSQEYYITDVPALLLASGRRVEVLDAVPPEDILSINTPEELAHVDAIYRRRASGQGDRGAGAGA